jgi:GEVED domain
MKIFLLEKLNNSPMSFNSTKKVYLALLLSIIGFTVNAQCIGPYARFEAFGPAGITPPASFTSSYVAGTFTSPTIGNSTTNARSGGFFMLSTLNNSWLKTPAVSYAKTFSFYVRNSTGSTGTFAFTVEYSTDDFVTPININTVSGYTLPASVTTSYQLVSVTLPYINSTNIKFRITDNTVRPAAVGQLFVDDMTWDTYTSSGAASIGYPENTTVAPVQTGNGAPLSCAGGTINVPSNGVYNFYDNGGSTDQYNINQTNQVTFMPVTAGDNVRVQFITYAGAATEKAEIWDNDSSSLVTGTNLLTHTATTIPATTTYVSSIASNGAVTVKFTSDGATNSTGFNIKVDCTNCPKPTSLSSSSVGATTANLNWGATTASNYDVYYGTLSTLVLPLSGTITTSATNSISLSGLTTGVTYYAWVRSNCGATSYSSWYGPISFTTTNCAAFVLASSPSSTTQNLCLNAAASTLTASASGGTVSTYQWYSNTTSSTTGGTAVGTNSGSYTPLTTAAGTLYYYCLITSTTACPLTTTVSGAVTITAPPATAPVATAGTGATTTTFTANWGAVAGATGYYLDVATDAGFTALVSGYNNLNVLNVLTYGVSGLATGTTYYYRVRAYNTCGTTASSNPITQATVGITYCAISAPSTTTTSVNSFSTTGGITNITNNTTGFTTGGYADYTAQSCSQYPSSLVNYSITSLRTDSTDQTFFYYIWIDWNNNGSFADAGETILATTTYQSGPFTGTFAVPAGQAAGSYRMRVSTSWVGANTSCAINASGRGEMEDYTVVVVSVPPCATSTPSALTTASVSATSAIISWTDAAMTPNSIYNYYYNTTGTTPLVGTTPSGTVTGATSASLTGLTLGVTYYFWVRSNCGTPSTWVGSANFTTINQDIVNMTNGSITSCNVLFYDSAGPVTNYNNSETYTYTFYPSSPTSKLKVIFNSFVTENRYDGLSIYNGNSTAAPLISSGLAVGTNATTCPAGSFYGTNSPGTIISTAADGSLTFQFSSDTSVVLAGWDATITCVTVPIITSFTPTSVCQGAALPTVTLTGTNFTGATSVKFNGTTAVYTVNSNTSITTTLPAGATTGYITVANAQATGTSTSVFTVNPIPSVPNAGSPVTICSGASTTLAATASGSFTTTVLSQDFNAGPWPSGWTRTSNGGFSPGDFRTSSEFVSGGNSWAGNGHTGFCSYFYSFSIPSGVSGDMISPAMDMSTYTAATLTFWVYNSAGTDLLEVYANNNGGAYSQVGTTYLTYGAWTQITISLNSFVGAGFNAVTIKFSGKSDGGSSNIAVDDIIITGDTAPTNTWSPSTGLSATNILNPVASPTTNTTYTLTSTYGNGCSTSSSVAISVNPRPTITASASTPTLCYSASAQSTTLAYSATTNTPTTYSITWNAAPTNSFVAVTDVALPASPITINVPAGAASGTYTGNLTVKNAIGCVSVVSTFTVTVGAQSTITTSPSAISQCGGIGSTTLGFSVATGSPVSYSIVWNASPANTFAAVTDVAIPGGTTIPITIPGGTAAGTYTGNTTVKNASGCVSTSIPFTVTISAQPTIALAASAAPACFSTTAQTTTLSYNTPFGSPTVYTLTWGASAITAGFTNLGNTALPAVIGTAPISISVPANAAVATYTGNIIVKNAGACASSSMSFTIQVKSKPTITSGFVLDPLCVSSGAQTATLGYSASTVSPTSYSIDWNAAANTAGLPDQGATAYAFINGDDTINNINIAANLPANQYSGTITISNASGCTNSYAITLYIGKKWNGITSTDWATASNWTPSGEPTASDYCVIIPSGTPFSPIISSDAFCGDLTINSGATLTVNSGIAVEVQDFVQTDGTLTMNNNSSLVQIDDVPNLGAGNMVYKRNVSTLHGYDYIYWSSPVASQPINGLYATPTMGSKYYWNTLVNNGNGASGNTSQGNWSVASGTMNVGKGYIVRASFNSGWLGNLTSTFTGIPNNGTITVPIARGSFQGGIPYVGINGMTISNMDDNMNLIGNPYPSSVRALDFLGFTSNANTIEGFIYLWTHSTAPSTTSNPFYSSYITNYFTSDYLTYNSSGTSSGPGSFNGYIAAGQSFFITMKDGPTDSSQSVTFTNDMRSQSYNNSQFYKTASMAAVENDKHRIWLDLVDSSLHSTRTLVGYVNGATLGKDRNFDAYTKVNDSNIIYSLVDGESQVIQGRPVPFDSNDQVQLGFHAAASGNYTIAIGAVDGLFLDGQAIYLEDKLTDTIYDLRQAPYVFSSTEGTFNSRFVLRYTNTALSSNQYNLSANAAAIVSNKQLQIKATETITSIQVYDISGKLVKTYLPTLKSNELIEEFPFEKGVYFAKIKLDNGSLVTQKVMN